MRELVPSLDPVFHATLRASHRSRKMTLCPIAIVVGCKKCPALGACPLKSVIGDYRPEVQSQSTHDAAQQDEDRKTK